MNNLHLQISARPEEVGTARRHVADFTRRLAWSPDDVDAILLAVGEACNNAVSYGGQGIAAPVVSVTCRLIAPDRLQVEVQNQGNGFHPDLDVLEALPQTDAFATHGRGFALMRALMDDVQVLSDGMDTTVRLTKSKSA